MVTPPKANSEVRKSSLPGRAQSKQQKHEGLEDTDTIFVSQHISQARVKQTNMQKANSQHDLPEDDPSSKDFSSQLKGSRTS